MSVPQERPQTITPQRVMEVTQVAPSDLVRMSNGLPASLTRQEVSLAVEFILAKKSRDREEMRARARLLQGLESWKTKYNEIHGTRREKKTRRVFKD